MSNLLPTFATAPRIKLLIDGKVVAYAIGFNVNVSLDVQPVMVLGEYGPVALEPTMYNTVTGTMQIVRLRSATNLANDATSAASSKTFFADDAATTSTIVSSSNDVFGADVAATQAKVGHASNTPLNQKNLFRHLDAANLLLSRAFDIDLYMLVPAVGSVVKAPVDSSGMQDIAGLTGVLQIERWMTIKNCRITSRNTNISMAQLVNEPLNFQGLLAAPEAEGFSLDSAIKDGAGVPKP